MNPGSPPLETTVTFLFTDIEASTRLWEHYPEAMRDDLALHDALMHDFIHQYGGHVFKTIGDAFCAAFPTPEEAVGAATAIQQALRREVPQLRVRMAVHVGDAVARDGDYFGPAVNRVARLLIAGHGGQILLSQATVRELEGHLPPDTRLESMGEHRLRDLASRERIHQLLFPGLPDRFPPLNTLDTAYRRGLMRASGIAAVLVALLAGLAIQARRAERAAREGAWQRRVADERQRQIRYRTYSARLRQAQRAEEDHDSSQVLRLLDDLRPGARQEDLRGFEWRYLWRRARDMSRTTLRGHIGGVLATAVSPDGKTIASCGEYDVRLWDMRSGQQTALFEDKRLVIFCDVAFSPDGKMVAASWASRVELRDRSSGRILAMLRGEQGVVGPVEFSPDGRWLASGGQDGTVKLWDVGSRRVVASFPGFAAFVGDPFPQFVTSSLAFSPDSQTLAVCEADGRVGLWNLGSRRKVASFKAHEGPVWSVAFSPDGRRLTSGGGDQAVRLWEGGPRWGKGTAAPRETARLRGHTAGVNAVAFSPDSRLIASASDDQTIRLWHTDTRREMVALHGHQSQVWTVAFAPDGKTLVSAGGAERTVRLWDVEPASPNPIVRRARVASLLAFSPDGKLLASAYRDGTVGLADARTGRPIAVLKGHTREVSSLAFSPDGRLLASGGKDEVVKLWDMASRQVMRSLPGFQGDSRGIAFMPDSRTLAMRSGDGVKLVDRTTGRVKASFSRLGLAGGIALSRDGKLLAALTNFGVVTVWDTRTRRVATRVAGFGPLAFSPDARTLAVDTFYPAPKLVDLATHQVAGSLSGHSMGGSLVFSPDGRTVATRGAHANDILLWNGITQDEVTTLKGHTGSITALAFSPDGTTLASSSVDGTLSLWQASTFRQSDPPRVAVSSDHNSILLQWQPVPSAVGYHVYQQPAARSAGEWPRIARLPISQTRFLDSHVDGVVPRSVTYAVAPVFREASGEEQGERVVCKGALAAVPPGFRGYRIQEESGSAWFDSSTGSIDISGSGEDIWDRQDQCYYLCRPVTGDFQVSVQVLTRPTYTDRWAKAGLMLRDTPEAGARNAFLFATAGQGLAYQWRPQVNSESEIQQIDDPWRPGASLHSEGQQSDEPSLLIPSKAPEPPVLRVPLTLRLTRRGDVVTGEYSTDGRRFHPAGRPWAFTPPLPRTVNIGLAITSHKFGAVTTARFQDLVIREQ